MLWAIPFLIFKIWHYFNQSASIEHFAVALVFSTLIQVIFIVGTFGYPGLGFAEDQHYPYQGAVTFLRNLDVFLTPVQELAAKFPVGVLASMRARTYLISQ